MQAPGSKNIESSSGKNYTPIIEWIKIDGLFGNKDINLDLTDRCRILIGNNGIGKTTILKIINYLLDGHLEKLSMYPFQNIEIKFHDLHSVVSFNKTDIFDIERDYNAAKKNYPEGILELLIEDICLSDIPVSKCTHVKVQITTHKDIKPGIYTFNVTESLKKLIIAYPQYLEFRKYIYKNNLKVIYLPSYRRIEATLDELLVDNHRLRKVDIPKNYYYESGFDSSNTKVLTPDIILNHVENLKFGMEDIQAKIDGLLQKISKSSVMGYSEAAGKMINHFLESGLSNNYITYGQFDETEVSIVLERVGSDLSNQNKSHILDLVRTGDIFQKPDLVFFIQNLLEIYYSQKLWDSSLKAFELACNKFFYDKSFIYDESKVEVRVGFHNGTYNNEQFTLNQLSSGEKQIVSLMASLFLETEKNLIVLIDEPENSISIDWQKILLPTML